MMSSLFTKTVIYLQPRVKNTYVTSLNRQKSGLLIDVLNMYAYMFNTSIKSPDFCLFNDVT